MREIIDVVVFVTVVIAVAEFVVELLEDESSVEENNFDLFAEVGVVLDCTAKVMGFF